MGFALRVAEVQGLAVLVLGLQVAELLGLAGAAVLVVAAVRIALGGGDCG